MASAGGGEIHLVHCVHMAEQEYRGLSNKDTASVLNCSCSSESK